MSLLNKPEVGASLKKYASKLVCNVCEVWWTNQKSELVWEKCASKLVCDVCMSLVKKPEVGAGLKKVCE